ncbi:hypothetical protein ACJIZ3_019219 [Penstemon smallii]|uniref:Uncharacterized protein n=1 Tax=Penstemon smallii TaxID=265156 RepID=A0ABD3T0J3_9LAMI
MEPGNITSRACNVITEKLDSIPSEQPKCMIYRVHSHLRKVNDDAYEPEIIAIGPYHRDKTNLKMLEEHKFSYLNLLLQRKNENIEMYASTIGRLQHEARKCYAEPIELGPSEFTEMLVIDGCFIIELVLKYNMVHLRGTNDPIFQMEWIMNSLQRDLMLFENQIPFFILVRLFDLIHEPVPDQHNGQLMVNLFFSFFKNLYPGKVSSENLNPNRDTIKHLLDLIHSHWFPTPSNLLRFGEETSHIRKSGRLIKTATGLRKANVKFRRNEGSSVTTMFDVGYNNGTILMAPMTIEYRTECFLRNLIAFEQYLQDSQTTFVTDYVKLLDCLIDSSGDVEVLSRFGIIDNWLGDYEVVANMVNKLTDSVASPGKHFIYGKLVEIVNSHCKILGNRWMEMLRRNYWNSPWATISIIAAAFLLLLSIAQTVSSTLQVV